MIPRRHRIMSPLKRFRGAIRREKIRRLYNNKQFSSAIKFASQDIESTINGPFAQDIIVRGLWNLGQLEELIDFASAYNILDGEGLVEKAKNILDPVRLATIPPPKIAGKKWNGADLLANWYQLDSILWLRHPSGWVYWNMPKEFNLCDVHSSLLHLAMEVLLHPIIPEITEIVTEHRSLGTNLALSYSGGVDSTAAAMLLPENAVLAYHKRDFQSMVDHRLAETLFEGWKTIHGREVLQIPSNHELLRTTWGKPVGFSTDFAAAAHLILLAETLDLGTIAFGTPIDNTWLAKGKSYRNFERTQYWVKWKSRFRHAGLQLEFPINHISEAGALRICQKSPLLNQINSCLRGDGETWCGACWKCFHKNGPLGRAFNFQSNEIQSFLSMRPLRTAQHALWAIQTMGLQDSVPQLKEHLQTSLDWWEGYYPPGLGLVNDALRPFIEKTTRQYLKPMTQPYQLEMVDLQL